MAAVTSLVSTVATGSLFAGCVVVTASLFSTAYAEWAPAGITYTGNVAIDAAATEALTVTENSVLTYGYAGNVGSIAAAGFDIKLVGNAAGVQMNASATTITSQSVWLSQGRFLVNGTTLADAGTVYAQGGQLYINNDQTITNAIMLGSSTYTETGHPELSQAAIRFEGETRISGAVTLVEDAAITIYSGTGTISSKIDTAGHTLEKKGNGVIAFSLGSTSSLQSLALSGGTLRSTYNGNNGALAVGALDVKASSTLEHNSWNGIWTIGDLKSSVSSATHTLTFNNSGSHWFRTQFILKGTSTIDVGSLFDGVIDVKHTGPNNNGTWQVELHAGTATQLSRAVVNLNNYGILAVTAGQVELEGLTSTSKNAYVFSGANGDTTTHMNGDNNASAPLYTVDGTVRTLTLSGNGDYSFTGTLAGNLTIEKTGSGLQTFGNIGDNVTINLHSGSLSIMGTVGSNTSVHAAAGTNVSVPWELTHEGDIYTATFKRPDYITGEGEVTIDLIAAVGDTSLSTNDGKYTKLDVRDYAKDTVTITSGLVSIITGNTAAPGTIADFGPITTFILDGGGFILPTSADQVFTFDKNIVVQSNGYLRSWGNETTSSTLRLTGGLSGTGKLTKTDGGTITLAGDMSGFSGGLVIGKGGIIFDTDAALASLDMQNNSTLGITGGHRVSAASTTSSPWIPKAGTFSFKLEDGGDFSTHRIKFANATTLNLTSETNGSLTVNGLQCADMGNTTINVGARTALNVTGDSTGSSGNFTTNNTFLLTHWQSKAVIVVEGTLNMLNHGQFAAVNPNKGNPTIDVKDGGILNLKGLDVIWRDGVNANGVIVTLEQGSAMHLGSGGISTVGGLTLTLNGGTLGILDSTLSWSTNKELTLAADTVVDTRLYTAATDGSAGSYTSRGGTISMLGAITGNGTLIKQGAGTLNLANVGKLDVREGLVGMNGVLTINSLTGMTQGGGRFLIDLGTDSVTAAGYSGLVNLTANATVAGTYTVFTGSAALTAEQIDLSLMLDRGLTWDASTGLSVSNGAVSITIGGTASSEHYNLTWAGDAGEVWSNSAVQAWTGADDQRFSTGDNVTFDGGGIKNVTISGIVSPGSITVSGTENYTISDGFLAGSGALTKTGSGKLTLETDASGWSGAINLQEGELAFRGSLGTGDINVSNTATLSWLKGNLADISSRLKIAADTKISFAVDAGDTVSFGTRLTVNTATYTKTGAGTLKIANNGALQGHVVVAEGTLQIAGNSANDGAIYGTLTVEGGAKLLVERGNFTGWTPEGKITKLLLEENSEIILGVGSEQAPHSLVGENLTMNGATISSTVTGTMIEFTSQGIVTVGGGKLSTIEANVRLDKGGDTGTVFRVADAVAGDGVDLLIKGNVSGNRSNTGLDKQGAGTMEITGKYTAGDIRVSAGDLIMHDAEFTAGLTVAAGASLTVAANSTFLWDFNNANRSIAGALTIEQGATLQTRSIYKYHTTLDATASLSGAGTLITGFPTNSSQNEGSRNLYLNGNTAGFTGVIEMHGTGLVENTTDRAFRTVVYLNSADGVLGGVIRMQGAVFNGGWSAKDDSVVPLMNQIILQKDMVVGGIEGIGGTLKTDKDPNSEGVRPEGRYVLTIGRDDDHVFSGSIADRIDLVKTGSGKQTFNGDLSAFDGTISVQGGTLDMGSLNYAKNLSLSGANASLAAGKVTIGAGAALTVTATGTVVSSDLDIAGGTLNLGDMSTESHAVGLGGHSLALSTTNKTTLSLTLAGDLAAGATVDLFTNVSGLLSNGTALTLNDALLSDYFSFDGIAALSNAKLQFVGGKLQIVLARGTNSLLYGRGNNGIWKEGEAFDADGNLFTANTNVEFGAIANADALTVQLGGELSAGSITIAAGAGKTYHFVQQQGAAPAGSLVGFNGMTIDSGTADFAAGTLQPTAAATITVNGGTLSLQTGATNDHVSITLGDGATLLWGTGNTEDYAAGKRLTIADNAHVTLNVNGNRVVLGKSQGGGVNGSKGHVTLAGGGLVIGDGSVLHGTVDLGGQTLRLNGSAATYDLNIAGNGDLVVRGNVSLTGSNSFAGTLHIGDNGDAEGQSGSATDPVNATLTVTDTSLGNVTAIELTAGANNAGSTMNYSAAANATISAPITGTGDVNFSGGHEITLSGANTYAGKTGIGADTTLKVTDKTLSAHTDIGNAGGAGGTLHLTNTKADGAYDFANKVGEGVSVTLSGGTVNWLSDAGHEKTYTGTTTIATGTTVTAAGPLTTGANSKIVLTDATSILRLDLTGGMPASWTNGHTVSGAGMLALNGTGQTLSAASLASFIDTAAGAPTLGKLALTGGTLDVTSESQKAQLKQIQTLEIGAGAQLQVRSRGLLDQAGLALSLAGAGTGDAGTGTAAALYFGNGDSIGAVTRNVSLAADAAVYVDTGKSGTLSGSFTGNGHTLTKTGDGSLIFTNASGLDTGSFTVNAGTLQFSAGASGTFGTVGLSAGTTLSFYNSSNSDNKLTVSNLALTGDATLQTTYHSGSILVGNLTGANRTLTIDGASSATQTQFVVVQGGTFSGVIDVRQSNGGNGRCLVFAATGGDVLAQTTVKLSQLASPGGTRLLAFAVGGAADGTIKIAGLEGIADATVISTNTFNRNNTSAETLADGNARTLEIVGGGTGAFSGSIGANLTVRMNGTGTQTLSGALADGTRYEVAQGKLALSGANQTGSHTFTAKGGTLDMAGYARTGSSASVADSIIANGGTVSNLTLGNGMELKAADSYTGAVALGGTTTLAGGNLVFRLKAAESSPGYHDLETSYAVQTGGSIAIGGSAENKTILTFVPVDKRLDPGTNRDGQDYVLIANVGTAFGAAGSLVDLDAHHLGFNMSTEGRTEYTLKVVANGGENNLVLNVSGAAATLVWKGDQSEWNTSRDNLAWVNPDDGGNASSFYEDDLVVFDTLDSAQTVTVGDGGVRMGGMLVKGGTDYTFNGGAISSSVGNTEATLTVGGEGENLFTGTLTLNVANTYAGDTFIHNGTVAANHAGALSNTETHLDGGRLELNFDGTFGASALTMAGGALHAGADANVTSIQLSGTDSAKTLSAADGQTLTLTSSTGTLEGALTVGSAAAADAAGGTVTFSIGTTSLSHAQDATVLSGTLELAGTTGSYTGSGMTLGNGNLKLTGGITATFASLQQAASGTGKVVIDGSTLLFSATAVAAPRVEASDAVIGAAAGQTLTLQDLYLKAAEAGRSSATLTGNVTLAGLSQENETALLTVGSADAAGQATLGASVTNVGNVAIVNGSLTVKDGDRIEFLESHGSLTTLADEAGVSTGKIWLKNGSSIDAKITLTINGAAAVDADHSWLGDQPGQAATTVGDVIIDHADAQVHFGAELTAAQVTIKQGTLSTNYAATVTNGISLEGPAAVLNLMGIDSVDAVTLKQGELKQAGAFAGTLTIDDAGANSTYALGGLTDAATVDIRRLGAGSSLTGLAGLKLGTATITLTEGMDALFVMNDAATGTVSLTDDGRLDVVCSGILNNILQAGGGRYTVTNGSLGGLLNADGSLKGNVVFDPTMNLYNVVAEVDGGSFTFTQLTPDDSTVYTSSEEGVDIGGADVYKVFDAYTKVNVDVDTTIDLTEADRNPADAGDGLVVKNLHSLAEGAPATLTITGSAPAEGTPNDLVTLNNSLSDTWFGGNIHIENADLQIKHSNATDDTTIDPTERELTLRGTLTTDSLVHLQDGKLALAGNGNVLGGGLSFNDDATAGEKGLLEIGGNTDLGGAIEGAGGTTADMLLTNGSSVNLLNGATLGAWMQGTGAETLAVGANNTATIENGAKIEDVRLNIAENGVLAIESTGAGDLLLNGLGGKGELRGGADAELGIAVHEGQTSVFSGSLDAYKGKLSVTGAGTQVLAASAELADIAVNGGTLALRTGGQISDDGSNNLNYKDIRVTGGGSLRFDTAAYKDDGLAANNTVSVGSLTVGGLTRAATTDTLVFDFNLTNDLQGSGLLVSAGTATLTNATVQLNIKDVASDFVLKPDTDMSFTLMSGITDGSTIKPDLAHSAIIDKYFGSSAAIRLDGSNLVFTGTTVNGDTAHFHADAATTETGRAGADLLDYYYATQNPQSTAPGSLAAGVLGALEGVIAAGDKAQADRIMSRVAGATVTTLSSAFAAGLDARLNSIRARMAGMGVDQTLVNEDMPYFHAWISADGGNTTLDADGTLAGYKLNSWGGTVGVDVDVNDYLTLGAAFTASYGDLTADGAETADGNLDTYTAAVFAHAQVRRWSHDMVLAVSTADADLDRTVDYGTGNYTAKGSTNGLGFGALYELAYNIPVGEEAEDIFSPLFRASFTHVSVDAYTETQAESMGLAVGKQDVSYATFGLGARYVAAVGENVFNRTATLELRAMVLQDAGSRRGEADVALGGSAGRTRTVRGAEPGSTGIQVGASLNVPIEESSAIFADVNLDARSKTTTVNGSVGYRINF